MSSIIHIKSLKEQVSHAIDVGDHVTAASILNEHITTFDNYPAFTFKSRIEISVLQHGLDTFIDQLKLSSNQKEKYLIEGVLNISLKRYNDALELFASALELSPDEPLLCYFAGSTCIEKGLLSDAVKLFTIPQDSMLQESYLQLGRCYAGLDQDDLAYFEFERSFRTLESDEALLTLLVFMRQNIRASKLLDWGYVQRLRVLLEKYKRELPDNKKDVLKIEAAMQYITGDVSSAITSFGEIIKEFPADAESKRSLAYILLGEGAFKEAYALNPSREQTFETLDNVAGLENLPKWNGQALDGQKLMVVGEQGLGDRILLSRFLNTIKQKFKPKSVTLVIDSRLVPIIKQGNFPQLNVLSLDDAIPVDEYDTYCHLSDLLFILGPAKPPQKGLKSYLNADKSKIQHYRNKYKKLFPGKVTVGLTWKSSSNSLGSSKDLVLRELGALLRIPNVQWVALQYGDISEDIETINSEHECELYCDETVDQKFDLEAAFAQVSALDYVVTISNATAHICGALGVPASVLVSQRPPWHWLTSGERSCWYQSLRLVRQQNTNTWYRQLNEVADYLCARFKNLKRDPMPTIGEVRALFYTSRLELLMELISAVPTEQLPPGHLSFLAELYLNQGEVKKCTDIVAPLLEQGIETDQNLLLMAKAGRLLSKYKETDNLLGLIKGDFYYEEVQLERMSRALDLENYYAARDIWKKVLAFKPSIKNLDLLSAFLFQQREWITLRSDIPDERIQLSFEMVDGFDQVFGYRNPVVGIILRAELSTYIGNIDSGVSGFRKALSLRPELSKMLNSSLGYCLLMKGEFKEGFKRHSSMREVDKVIFSKNAVTYPDIPMLNEKEVLDTKVKRILVTCEQGIGDQLLNFQFLRKFQKLYNKEILVTVSPKLVDMIRRNCPDIIHVQSEVESLPNNIKRTIQRKVHLGNLPLFMLDEFDHYQAEVDWLRADPSKVAYFKDKYASLFPGKKLVGLSWRSASSTWGSSKDVNLKSFLPILKDESIQVISIQYADISQEVAQLGDDAGTIFLDPEVDITNDLESTIALIEALDFVVTVSNVNAHYTGALNKRGLVLLKARSLWHWLHNTNAVPWYPSLELIRESDYKNTDSLINNILEKI